VECVRRSFLLPFLLSACVSSPRLEAPDALAPLFSPRDFFVGRTEGVGVLRVALSAPRSVRVHGIGHLAPGGDLVLRQTVEEQGKPATRREWRIRQASPGLFVGSLSDAAGPIRATVSGNRLRLRFRMKSGLEAEQWIYLKPGGASAHNLMTVRKFGVVVATLDETIDRVAN
jgi:Protein of unknown function (DUF3833)